MKIELIITLVFLFASSLSAQSVYTEKQYSDHIQYLLGGEREYSIKSGRVDLLTSTNAYEIERANKWKQSIGQSLWYGMNTNRKPGIILIIEKPSDYKYFQMLNSALTYAGIEDGIDVLIYPDDFKKYMK